MDRNRKIIVVCDFDGTITTRDMSGSLARHLDRDGSRKQLFDEFHAERLSLYELQRRSWPQVQTTQSEIDTFMDREAELRTGFIDFVGFCRQHGIDFRVVSAGFTFYIPYLLTKFGFGDLYPNAVSCNEGYVEGNRVNVSFPHRHPSCDYCSNCKGHYIRELRRQVDAQPPFIVGIGDGASDRCMAREADLLFARHHLLRYCGANGIVCTPFESFAEVAAGIALRIS